MVIAGAITLGVPYVIGLSFASSADFPNATGWLIVPGAGPWLALAFREKCDSETFTSGTSSETVDCVFDPVVTTYLVIDGLAQTTGAILLLVGIAYKRQRLVRDEVALLVRPARVGTGYGVGVTGTF